MLEPGQNRKPQQSIWLFVLATSIVITFVGGVLAVIGFNNAIKGDIPARSIWGGLIIVLGLAGPGVPVVLILKRSRFVQLHPQRQWLAAAIIPGILAVLWAAALVFAGRASVYSTPIIPYTARLTLRFEQDGKLDYSFNGNCTHAWRSCRADTAALEIFGSSRPAGQPSVSIDGTIERLEGEGLELRSQLDLQDTIHIQTAGLEDSKIMVDDEPAPQPVTLKPGSYRLVIRGRLK